MTPFLDLLTIVYAKSIIESSRNKLMSLLQNKQRKAANDLISATIIIFYTAGIIFSSIFSVYANKLTSQLSDDPEMYKYFKIHMQLSFMGRSAFCFYREIMIIEQRQNTAFLMDMINGTLSLLNMAIYTVLVSNGTLPGNCCIQLAKIETLTNFVATLYPIYTLGAKNSSSLKSDIQQVLNHNPFKLRLSNFFPCKCKLLLQIGLKSILYMFKHALEPVLCTGIMMLYFGYIKTIPVWSKYGMMGCQLTRIFSQIVGSIQNETEKQLRHLFSININAGNISRVRSVLLKEQFIMFIMSLLTGVIMFALTQRVCLKFFAIDNEFKLVQTSFSKSSVLWCLTVPLHFVQPLIETEFRDVEGLQIVLSWVFVIGQLLLYVFKKKRVQFNIFILQLMLFQSFIGVLALISFVIKFTDQLKMKKNGK
ncbi:Hypothetical_protein [Hexamita inflata]|uniref:Hypothetical_protein n=1 Tax=Hexamita inflata TaxID=28002 RepID=A0AA86PSY8_9EUKA|nr:Hypothetical protein HINF_LOCUS5532 [Hexamita inflata]CAI9945196.1 Hypothetical protein HINF_LOCUS32841 [Hexamita inflata]